MRRGCEADARARALSFKDLEGTASESRRVKEPSSTKRRLDFPLCMGGFLA